MKVVIASGGTGGHIYPGIAIAEELLKHDINNKVLFVGSEHGLEKDIIPRERYSIKLIKSAGVQRKFSFRLFRVPFAAFNGFIQSRKLLKEFSPDVVISTGGYVSFPVVLAAASLRLPVVLHEQNAVPGITNRFCQVFAKRVTTSFENSGRYFKSRKTSFVGNPVRRKVVEAVRSVARQKLNLDQKSRMVIILGGSQGARCLNEVIVGMMDYFAAEGIQVVHVTGERDYDWVLARTENKILDIERRIPAVKGKKKRMTITKYKLYHPLPYMYNIWDGLAAADLAVSRAGGTAIAEITARGLPSILVPYPYAAADHQKANAKLLEDSGAAVVLADDKLSPESLSIAIKSLFSDGKVLINMSEACKNLGHADASRKIARIVYDVVGFQYEVKKKRNIGRTRKKTLQKAG